MKFIRWPTLWLCNLSLIVNVASPLPPPENDSTVHRAAEAVKRQAGEVGAAVDRTAKKAAAATEHGIEAAGAALQHAARKTKAAIKQHTPKPATFTQPTPPSAPAPAP